MSGYYAGFLNSFFKEACGIEENFEEFLNSEQISCEKKYAKEKELYEVDLVEVIEKTNCNPCYAEVREAAKEYFGEKNFDILCGPNGYFAIETEGWENFAKPYNIIS